MVSIMAMHRLSLLVLLVLSSFVLMLSAVHWPVPTYHLLVLLVLLAALVIRHAAIRRATHAMLRHRPLSATITRVTRVTRVARVARIKIAVALTTMTAILLVATTALRPLPLPLPLVATRIVFSPARFSILAVAVAVAVAAASLVVVLVVAVRELIPMMSVVGVVEHLVSGLCEPNPVV